MKKINKKLIKKIAELWKAGTTVDRMTAVSIIETLEGLGYDMVELPFISWLDAQLIREDMVDQPYLLNVREARKKAPLILNKYIK